MSSAINIVFDGPPGAVPGRFVEVEDDTGASVSVGQWINRPDDTWVLRIETPSLTSSVHHEHTHPQWGVEQVGWIGQSGRVYGLHDEAGLRSEPGSFSPLYQPRDEPCGHVEQEENHG